MAFAFCCIYVQPKPAVVLLNFRASRNLTDITVDFSPSSRKFFFILCHVSTLSMSTAILFASGDKTC